MNKGRSLATDMAALASYLVAGVIFTFPLIARFGTYFPSAPPDQDVYLFLWNNWWIHYAITVLHAKPYFTSYIIYPFSIDLRLGTLGLLYGILCLPILSWLGPVVVLNLQVIATPMLNGYAVFRLTRHVTRSDCGAFVAGLAFAAVPAVNFHLATGRPSCAALWPAIFMLHYSLKLIDEPDNRNMACLAVFVVATLAADQQAAMFGGLWLILLALRALVTRCPHVLDRRLLSRLGLVLVISVPPAYFLYYNSFVRTVGYTVPGAIEAYNLSSPVTLLWTPSIAWGAYGVALPSAVVIGLAVARKCRSVVFWLVGSAFFVALSFGPVVSGTRFPLPFSLLRMLPIMSQFRAPYRFQIPAAVGLCVTLGIVTSYVVNALDARKRRLLIAGTIVVVVGDLSVQRVVNGFPMQTMSHEPLYETIGRDDRDYVILEVPVGIRTGTDRIGPGEALSFHQPIHRKRLLNGSTSRLPLAALEYYRASPAIMFLAGEPQPPGDVAVDLQRRLKELRIGYVIVHPEMLESRHLKMVLGLLDELPSLRRIESTDVLIAYRSLTEAPDRPGR